MPLIVHVVRQLKFYLLQKSTKFRTFLVKSCNLRKSPSAGCCFFFFPNVIVCYLAGTVAVIQHHCCILQHLSHFFLNPQLERKVLQFFKKEVHIDAERIFFSCCSLLHQNVLYTVRILHNHAIYQLPSSRNEKNSNIKKKWSLQRARVQLSSLLLGAWCQFPGIALKTSSMT